MGTEQWHPDIIVTGELVRKLITDQFPVLTPIKAFKKLSEGWDNKVYLLNNTIIFRFPHRKIAVEQIEHENIVLNAIQSQVSLAIPHPIYFGKPSDIYPYSFHGYQMLTGISGCHAALTEAERIASIKPLAKFLKQLHNISETEAKKHGIKSQLIDRSQSQPLISRLHDRVDKLIKRNIVNINLNNLQQEFQITQNISLPKDDKVLIHGDLYCRHLLFNQKQLTGVIDWGDSGINHRAIDLAIVFNFYPSNCHQTFFAIYGQVDKSTWQYARFFALYSSLTVMLYAASIGDNQLQAEVKAAIKRINPTLLIDY